MDAAYSFALRLAGNQADAADIVQDAYIRAYRYFESYRGTNARLWIFKIVRNQFYTRLEHMRRSQEVEGLEERHENIRSDSLQPDESLEEQERSRTVREAVSALPPEFREVIVLRELEELDYKQIASMLEIPLGTVMSRLSRGRTLLRQELSARLRM